MSLASVEIIRVLYQHGAFTAEDTVRTSGALAVYILGLPGLIANNILSRIFHSLQRMHEKILLALQYLVTNVVGNLLLVDRFGVTGLAVATVVTITIHLYLSFWVLHRYRIGLDARRLAVITTRHYAIMGATAALFLLLGLDELCNGVADRGTTPGALAVGVLKGTVVLALYFVLFTVQHRARALLRRSR